MKATFRTRCGCERQDTVTFPAPSVIVVPLMRDPFRPLIDFTKPPSDKLEPTKPLECRRFKLYHRDSWRLDSPLGHALYYEDTL